MIYAAATVGAFYAMWVLYLAVMSLDLAHSRKLLTKPVLYAAMPILVAGYVLDVVLNVVVLTVLLLELPQEPTISERLRRHNEAGDGWRAQVAKIVEPFLDPFDRTGNHI